MQPSKAIETLRFYTGNITAFRGQQEKDPCGLTRGDYALIDAAINAVTNECVEADTLRKDVEKLKAENEVIMDENRNMAEIVEQQRTLLDSLPPECAALVVDEA